MNTIQSEWEEFRDKVVPEDAPNEQIRDMEIAFYSGAHSLLNLTMVVSQHKEDAAVEMLEGLHVESNQFFVDRENENKEDSGVCMMCFREKSESSDCDRENCISKNED